MAGNKSLGAAKIAKQDEFYTQRVDIENELRHYAEHFRDKVVYCNCDDPVTSEFWQFFVRVFKPWGLKKLIATHYEPNEKNYSYSLEICEDTNGDGRIDINDEPTIKQLPCNGDFRSAACIELLLQEADIVVTNPPFSLFREYVAQLMEYGKKFIVIGSKNAITYKEFFPYLKDNLVWLGHNASHGSMKFSVTVGGSADFPVPAFWYTNLDIPKRHEPLDLRGNYYRGNEEQYPHYDNYDAIEVSKTTDIPCDYYGTMGVPISFLDKYCPEQFDIVGITKTWFGMASKVYPAQKQIDKTGKVSMVSKLNDGPVLSLTAAPLGMTYYEVGGKFYKQTYARVLICRRGVVFVVVWAQTIPAPKVRTFGQNVAWAQTVRKVA